MSWRRVLVYAKKRNKMSKFCGATTLSIMTFSIMTLGIMGLNVTLSIID
jgi:hypothetical protein